MAHDILIVDDEPKIRSFIGRALNSAGYATESADCGTDGLRRALAAHYDLVILDLVMPDLDGRQVLGRLLAEHPDQAVIVLSCVADVAAKVDCLERGAQAGPFARLRMQSHVAEGAHIGNFVELKKTRLGADAKANHLAYLGDSQIGAKVNIGAGTITCNYDGHRKHPTAIGDGAFIGSNSTLVAPIEIGAGAYVGAGSVITQPVPPDALGLGRAHQVIKDEWARKRRSLQKS